MTDVSHFRSQFGKGFARTNRFQVLIHPYTGIISPTGTAVGWGTTSANAQINRKLQFMAHEASVPSRSIETSELRYYGPDFSVGIHGSADPITISFYNQDNMDVASYFHSWLDFIQGGFTYDFAFPDEYVTSIEIEKLNDIGKVVQRATLLKAFPVTIMEMQYLWGDDSPSVTKVQFQFTDFSVEPVEENE
jgi:hypothetical protein